MLISAISNVVNPFCRSIASPSDENFINGRAVAVYRLNCSLSEIASDAIMVSAGQI
jgi:hypothetical protein